MSPASKERYRIDEQALIEMQADLAAARCVLAAAIQKEDCDELHGAVAITRWIDGAIQDFIEDPVGDTGDRLMDSCVILMLAVKGVQWVQDTAHPSGDSLGSVKRRFSEISETLLEVACDAAARKGES